MQRRSLMIMRRIFMHAPKCEYRCNFSIRFYALFDITYVIFNVFRRYNYVRVRARNKRQCLHFNRV